MTDISVEYKQMMRRLHEETHPERQEGEFTVDEYAQAQKPPLSHGQAENELGYYYKLGKVEKPPKRFIEGHMRLVYKLTNL